MSLPNGAMKQTGLAGAVPTGAPVADLESIKAIFKGLIAETREEERAKMIADGWQPPAAQAARGNAGKGRTLPNGRVLPPFFQYCPKSGGLARRWDAAGRTITLTAPDVPEDAVDSMLPIMDRVEPIVDAIHAFACDDAGRHLMKRLGQKLQQTCEILASKDAPSPRVTSLKATPRRRGR